MGLTDLTEVRPGDKVQFTTYLAELKKMDSRGLLMTRIRFYEHVAFKHPSARVTQAERFMRKYRSMFESEVPRWAALGRGEQKGKEGGENSKNEADKQARRVEPARPALPKFKKAHAGRGGPAAANHPHRARQTPRYTSSPEIFSVDDDDDDEPGPGPSRIPEAGRTGIRTWSPPEFTVKVEPEPQANHPATQAPQPSVSGPTVDELQTKVAELQAENETLKTRLAAEEITLTYMEKEVTHLHMIVDLQRRILPPV